MRKTDLLPAWAGILAGRKPFLSIEITSQCPLHCPGCYVYDGDHLNNGTNVRDLVDLKGEELVNRVLEVVRKHRPLHVSIVGGEPLVRYRELDVLIPKLGELGVEVQVVTSAVREIPKHWAGLECLHLVVSVDGLPAEHDKRRAPATYERILQHIEGHRIIVHCTVTRQLVQRPGYLREFAEFWSARPEVYRIWYSLYTPQEGEESAERLTPADRQRALQELAQVAPEFPKVHLSKPILHGLAEPPQSPEECIFAQTTTSLSAGMSKVVTPCQFGGKPVCSECGCIASAGLVAVGRAKLGGILPVASIFAASRKIGTWVSGNGHSTR
jgi:MoaA/NifB/PqqE/SkfB family radical SAM enzyme